MSITGRVLTWRRRREVKVVAVVDVHAGIPKAHALLSEPDAQCESSNASNESDRAMDLMKLLDLSNDQVIIAGLRFEQGTGVSVKVGSRLKRVDSDKPLLSHEQRRMGHYQE